MYVRSQDLLLYRYIPTIQFLFIIWIKCILCDQTATRAFMSQ